MFFLEGYDIKVLFNLGGISMKMLNDLLLKGGDIKIGFLLIKLKDIKIKMK